ncbi:hypothetical protein [Salibacterium lacus]|uniref:Uncharacterized protein n=1 Tax=Salibacterium lacus TaxID=1898109 RepID=A0ABW5T500_9BACI
MRKWGESIEKLRESIEKMPIHARIDQETSESIDKTGESMQKFSFS